MLEAFDRTVSEEPVVKTGPSSVTSTELKSVNPQEPKILKTGYADLLHRSWPINDDLIHCRNPEAAYVFEMERETLNVPENLQWENLKNTVPNHIEDTKTRLTTHKRLEAIWQKVISHRNQLFKIRRTLIDHWEHPPFEMPWNQDKSAKEFMKETEINVKRQFQSAVQSIISTPRNQQEASSSSDEEIYLSEDKLNTPSSKLESWQVTERQLRSGFFRQIKIYTLALRLYYEMLLENTEKRVNKKVVKTREQTTSTILARREVLADKELKAKGRRREAEIEKETAEVLLSEATTDEEKETAKKRIEELDKQIADSTRTIESAKKAIAAILPKIGEKKEHEAAQYILPKTHPLRQEIVIRNRKLKLIDARYQAIAVAKAAHHQQKGKRVRKHEAVPYLFHALDVTDALILDVVPFDIVKDTKKALNVVLIGILGPLHDIIEDTDLSVDDLVRDFLKRIIDTYDSSLDPVTNSGFKEDRQMLKDRILNLLKEDVRKSARKILRILSNNTVLTSDEKIEALNQNVAGPAETIRLTKYVKGETFNDNPELTEEERKEYSRYGINPQTRRPKISTFEKYPEDHDEHKLAAFLMRLTCIGEPKEEQLALIIKLEDRANNMLTINEFKPNKRRAILRATVTRLIHYTVHDHDRKNYPVYNALPRLIDNTITAYNLFRKEHPELTEQSDKNLIKDLVLWRKALLEDEDIQYQYELQEEDQDILEEFEERTTEMNVPDYIRDALLQAKISRPVISIDRFVQRDSDLQKHSSRPQED